QAVVERQAGTVGDLHAVQRDAGIRERLADDGGAGGGRSGVGELGAELLEQHLGAEVVALAIHDGDDVRQCRRIHLPELNGGGACTSDAHGSGLHPHCAKQAAERPSVCERGSHRDVVVVQRSVDDERRQRRALEDEVARLPAGRRPPAVEPALVAEQPAVEAPDAGGGHLRRKAGEACARQRRIAEALEEEIAVPGRPCSHALREDDRLEPVVGAELAERGKGEGELLVRRRIKREVRVTREHDAARAEVDCDGRGRGRGVAADGESVREPGRERERRCGRRSTERRGDDEDEGRPAHALLVLPTWRVGPPPAEDGPRGPSRRRRPRRESAATMTELVDRISTMISTETRDLDQIERTLTDGYAEALSLEAERWRIERRIAEVTQCIAPADTAKKARELAALAQRLDGNEGTLSRLRALLADLRRHANGVRVGSPQR